MTTVVCRFNRVNFVENLSLTGSLVDNCGMSGLRLNANANDACGNEVRQKIWYICTLAFAKASNRPYINILNANSPWSTYSRQIAFGCSLNICRTVECCLSLLGNTSTLNNRFFFTCCIHILFAFRCKPGCKIRAKTKFVYVPLSMDRYTILDMVNRHYRVGWTKVHRRRLLYKDSSQRWWAYHYLLFARNEPENDIIKIWNLREFASSREVVIKGLTLWILQIPKKIKKK